MILKRSEKTLLLRHQLFGAWVAQGKF